MYPILLTDEYMSFLAYDAFTSNATFIFGDQIPNIQVGTGNQ